MTSAEIVAAVTRTVHDYAAAVDGRVWSQIQDLLVPEVVLTRGEDTTTGHEEFHAAYAPFLASEVLGTRHVVTNVRVDETSPGAARAQACFEATTFLPDLTRRVIGRYDDELVLVEGRWLFAHKRNVVEFVVDLPAATLH